MFNFSMTLLSQLYIRGALKSVILEFIKFNSA
jgi:hypothetical protein